MQSSAKTVTDYLNEVPAERRQALSQLRDLCRQHLVGYEEAMLYGMPCYLRNGVAEIGFASQKHFIAFYIPKNDVMDAHREMLTGKGISLGKGCIRYSKPEKINFALVELILKANAESNGPICA